MFLICNVQPKIGSIRAREVVNQFLMILAMNYGHIAMVMRLCHTS